MSMVEYKPRLPVPQGQSAREWRVLTEVIFPFAKTAQSIVLALDYCRVRNLDVMKKPVNIVSVWSSELNRNVDTIWPSIGETQTTAARTGEWAGMDAPVYGPDVTQSFTGKDGKIEVTFPLWVEQTVYRIVKGQRSAFTERVYWLEAYARQGRTPAPNQMWAKRPHGQLQKVAKAAALRAAFPEEGGSPTDVEMEGQTIGDVQAEPVRAKTIPIAKPETYDAMLARDLNRDPTGRSEGHDPETGEVKNPDAGTWRIARQEDGDWQEWGRRVIATVRAQHGIDCVEAIETDNAELLDTLKVENEKMFKGLSRSIREHKAELLKKGGAEPGV